ncbi:TerB family tellurite resistance protein [Gammaproteobacteria bacterium]|nr:TerB family tellurite resistance protein [Gammaproteobacteria bacterium]
MFNFFKKKKPEIKENKNDFDIELTASILAYEIARSDGEISEPELAILLDEIKKISIKVGKEANKVLEIIEEYSRNSVSFYEFIDDINKNYSKDNKFSLIRFLYDVAYADKILEVNEERLIRRIADMIKIKDIEVLKIKDASKNEKKLNRLLN